MRNHEAHPGTGDHRFSRQELIAWWNQGILQQAKVLVIGAGALGNEILKNLALLGVGRILVVDFDRVELSNLSRSVLFREGDVGRSKAEVAARAVKELYPEGRVRGICANVVYDLGLGVFHWADLVIAGLDNREARVEASRNCWKTTTPLVDGAIEGLDGQVRLFVPPDGACYECTMSELDWKLLAQRRSCSLLQRSIVAAGHTPTTATISAIIAGLQCQEAVRWLHGISTLAGKGLSYNGTSNDLYTVTFPRREDCLGHETLGEFTPLGAGAAEVCVGDLLDEARSRCGPDSVVELNHDLLHGLECPNCHVLEEKYISLGKVTEDQARCPTCDAPRIVHTVTELDGHCAFQDRTLAQIGVPAFDVLTVRGDAKEAHLFLDGDAKTVLGDLLD